MNTIKALTAIIVTLTVSLILIVVTGWFILYTLIFLRGLM